MRTREFIIFIVVFTVIYILFFVIYDKVSLLLLKQKIHRRANSLIHIDEYLLFAQFYGINGTANQHTLKDIYSQYYNEPKLFISTVCNLYNLTSNEFAVVYLYLEYINVYSKKKIDLEEGIISSPSLEDLAMVNKYQSYLNEKSDYQAIRSSVGEMARQNLSYLDHNFLIPGVRFIDNELYYVGDINEKR